MGHDVFVSYASEDKVVADAVVGTLEADGVRCWVAPRDVRGGAFGAEIVDAISNSRLMVMVFSSHANASPHVLREADRAVTGGIPIIPLRTEDVLPSGAMDYYLASRHWLDALTPPLEAHLAALTDSVKYLLAPPGERPSRPPEVGEPEGAEPEPEPPPEPAELWSAVKGDDATALDRLLQRGGDPDLTNHDGLSLLGHCAYHGHREAAQVLLDHGARLEALSAGKSPPLAQAASEGHRELVQMLLDRGAAGTSDALREAARYGHAEVVRLLLERGADAADPGANTRPPLHWAVEHGHLEIVRMLLDHGADPCARDERGYTPLHEVGDRELTGPDIIELLTEHGADVDAANSDGETPLYRAALPSHFGGGRSRIVAALLDHGANPELPDRKGYTPLHRAAWQDGNLVRRLLDYMADIEARDNEGRTPLHLAAGGGNVDTTTALLQCGADVHATDDRGHTPLHRLGAVYERTRARDVQEVSRLLIAAGADVNARADDGATPLHVAVPNWSCDAAMAFIAAGADIEAGDHRGHTPLHVAAAMGKTVLVSAESGSTPRARIVEILLEEGAEVNATGNRGETPLHLAAMEGQATTVATLLAAGAAHGVETAAALGDVQALRPLLDAGGDPDAPAFDGRRPLHWAAGTADGGTVLPMLVEAGADVNGRDAEGETALHTAVRKLVTSNASTLVDLRADVNAQNGEGDTPLHITLGLTVTDVSGLLADILLRGGADVNARNHRGQRPLHVLAGNPGFPEASGTVARLVRAGANVRDEDDDGHTPLDVALARENGAVARLLARQARAAD